MKSRHSPMHFQLLLLLIVLAITRIFCYSKVPVQYHIQTDRGPNRYFRYQTYDGQYRREKRFEDGRVIGTYGWVDPTGLLRLYDYIADTQGYRIVRTRTMQVEKPSQISSEQNKKNAKSPDDKPRLRPLLVKKRRKPSVVSNQRRDKYKSVRQRIKERNKIASSQNNKIYFSQHIRTKLPKPSPVKINPVKRRKIPSRVKPSRIKPQIPSIVAPPKKRVDSFNPTFLTNNIPPDLGYDAPGGRVTIDFDIGVQYRKEKRFPGGVVVGEHGYVDPMGILRISYYRSDSGGKKEFRRSYWVGTRSAAS